MTSSKRIPWSLLGCAVLGWAAAACSSGDDSSFDGAAGTAGSQGGAQAGSTAAGGTGEPGGSANGGQPGAGGGGGLGSADGTTNAGGATSAGGASGTGGTGGVSGAGGSGGKAGPGGAGGGSSGNAGNASDGTGSDGTASDGTGGSNPGFDTCSDDHPAGKATFDEAVTECACGAGPCGAACAADCDAGVLDPNGDCYACVFPDDDSDPCDLADSCESDLDCVEYEECLGESLNGGDGTYCEDTYPDGQATFDTDVSSCACDDGGACADACAADCSAGMLDPDSDCYACVFPDDGSDPCDLAASCEADDACLDYEACLADGGDSTPRRGKVGGRTGIRRPRR